VLAVLIYAGTQLNEVRVRRKADLGHDPFILIGLRIGALAREAGFPHGVLSVLAVDDTVAAGLVEDPRVGKIVFTGSVATGKRVMAAAAKNLTPVVLELGGKDAAIVCRDADLDRAARGIVWGAFMNAGQTCASVERVYVERPVAQRFLERVVAETQALRVGDPGKANVEVGSMTLARQRQIVDAHVKDALAKGARALTGGAALAGPGFFYPPTVLTGVTHEMAIMREETFGPVAPIVRCQDIDEAIALADRSEYGLGASIYTNSLEHAMKAMEQVHAGTFWINDPLTDNDAGPFGGMRRSGIGRELGSEGIEDFRDSKHVHLDYVIGAKPYWYPYRYERPPE
jgi:acyl-CoA reductase-like NAD-dependent aldehyde dehydrogenase